jgi:hypothetical protein
MPGAVPLGKAGGTTVFPHAIWHAPSLNRSGKARKTILYKRIVLAANRLLPGYA